MDTNTEFTLVVLIIAVGIVLYRLAEAWERRGAPPPEADDDDELT